jgi:hypothetical protein
MERGLRLKLGLNIGVEFLALSCSAQIFGCVLQSAKAHNAIIKRPRYLFPKLDVNDKSLIIDHDNGKAVRAG